MPAFSLCDGSRFKGCTSFLIGVLLRTALQDAHNLRRFGGQNASSSRYVWPRAAERSTTRLAANARPCHAGARAMPTMASRTDCACSPTILGTAAIHEQPLTTETRCPPAAAHKAGAVDNCQKDHLPRSGNALIHACGRKANPHAKRQPARVERCRPRCRVKVNAARSILRQGIQDPFSAPCWATRLHLCMEAVAQAIKRKRIIEKPPSPKASCLFFDPCGCPPPPDSPNPHLDQAAG